MRDDLKSRVIELRDKGKTYPQIGKLLGMHPERARAIYRRASEEFPMATETTYSSSENIMQVSHVSDRIMSLDDLLSALEIDRDEWEVLRFKIHKGEMGRRHEVKSLDFDEGRITGSIEDSGNIHVEPLFNITAWLVRKKPIPVTPVVSPVNINISSPKIRKSGHNSSLSLALILPDTHFGFSKDTVTGALNPFHDRKALDITRQLADVLQPNTIIFLGDILDLPDWTDKFVKSPEFFWTTQAAVVEAAWWLGQFRELCSSSKIYILEGNHDKRMEDMLVKHLISAYQLKAAKEEKLAPPSMSIENLLSLKEMQIEYVGDYPNGKIWLNEAIACVHGNVARGTPGGTTGAVVRDLDTSEIHGHIHRKEWASRTIHGKYGTRTIDAFSPGCLCKIDGTVPAKKNNNNWQQGYALVYYDNEDSYSISPYPIEKGKSLINGTIIVGHDNLARIEKDTNWTLA